MSIKVLHVVNRWSQGGVECFIERLIEGSSKSTFDHDVVSLCTSVESKGGFDRFGPLLYDDSLYALMGSGRAFKSFLEKRPYDAVHIHTNNAIGFMLADAARQAGVPIRIVHSHNSSLGTGHKAVKYLAHFLCRFRWAGAETNRVAVSKSAGSHLFGRMPFTIINNGIDIARFSFDSRKRRAVRASYGIGPETLIMGGVGSFVPVKNHNRILEVFRKVKFLRPDAQLLLAGDGELKEEIEASIKRLGLTDSVIMAGYSKEMASMYSALDVVLMPSFYEGFPLVALEAQCNGVPVIMADTITDEACILPNVERLSLNASNEDWARAVTCSRRISAKQAQNILVSLGLSQDAVMAKIESLYKNEKADGQAER